MNDLISALARTADALMAENARLPDLSNEELAEGIVAAVELWVLVGAVASVVQGEFDSRRLGDRCG